MPVGRARSGVRARGAGRGAGDLADEEDLENLRGEAPRFTKAPRRAGGGGGHGFGRRVRGVGRTMLTTRPKFMSLKVELPSRLRSAADASTSAAPACSTAPRAPRTYRHIGARDGERRGPSSLLAVSTRSALGAPARAGSVGQPTGATHRGKKSRVSERRDRLPR